MTARQVWEGMLTELSKTGSPSMLLQDFNYFFNKAINQYINKRYNIYDINQQTSDDLRVLKATTTLKPSKITTTGTADFISAGAGLSRIYGATYEVNLPLDYLHMLNCVCLFKVNERFKCYDEGDIIPFKATRLTADLWSNIINDYYNRPLPERPYFYIHNINSSTDLPTNKIGGKGATSAPETLTKDTVGTDSPSDYTITGTTAEGAKGNDIAKDITINSNLPRKIDLAEGINNKSVVEREAGQRYGNSSGVRCEIRYGHDDSVFELVGVSIDYIKSPQVIRLTQEQVNLTKDTSQIMEFPDYVCQEIINELTMLVMENTADPRLSSNIQVTQSIANPAAQGQQQPQAQATGRQQPQRQG